MHAGITEAMWWGAGTILMGNGRKPRSTGAKIIWVALQFVGLVIMAVLLGYFQVSFLRPSLEFSVIAGPQDLKHFPTGVIAGTTSEAVAKGLANVILSYDSFAALKEGLWAKEVSAIVYDAPVLWNECNTNSSLKCLEHAFGKEMYVPWCRLQDCAPRLGETQPCLEVTTRHHATAKGARAEHPLTCPPVACRLRVTFLLSAGGPSSWETAADMASASRQTTRCAS